MRPMRLLKLRFTLYQLLIFYSFHDKRLYLKPKERGGDIAQCGLCGSA